jgi:hypothetical protein
VVCIGNYKHRVCQSNDGKRCAGYIPKVKLGKNDPSMAGPRRAFNQVILSHIVDNIEEYKDGFWLQLPFETTPRLFVPRLAFMATDWPEGQACTCVFAGAGKSNRSCRVCLCKTVDHGDNTIPNATPRSQRLIDSKRRKVYIALHLTTYCCVLVTYLEYATVFTDLLLRIINVFGIRCCFQAFLMNVTNRKAFSSAWGQHWDEPALGRVTRHTPLGMFDSCPPDMMHTLFKGLYEFVWATVSGPMLKDLNVPGGMSARDRRRLLDVRFEAMPKFRGNRRRSRKFTSIASMKVFTASDMEELIHQVSISLHDAILFLLLRHHIVW